MKVPVLSSLILLLGLSSHLSAIERPRTLDNSQPKERASEPQLSDRKAKDAPKGNENELKAKPAEAKPAAAWLGVLSEPLDETLGVHLDLAHGCVLTYVAEDSPASKAGLVRHDIIVEVDGAAIGNQDELREAIQANEPGEEVPITVVSKGQRAERKVVLGERPGDLPAVPRGGAGQPGPDAFDLGARFPDLRERMKNFEGVLPGGGDLHKQLEEHMKRLEKQLDRMEQGGGGLKLDLDMLENLPKPGKGAFNLDFKSSSSFKFFDNKGSVEMTMKEGAKEVVVKDKGGKLLFEGPWDTPQDKAAAPEEIRERIERMNGGNKFHFRLENLPEPKAELPNKKEPKLE